MTPIFKKKKLTELAPEFTVENISVRPENLVVQVMVHNRIVSFVKPLKFTGTLQLNFNEGGLRGVFEEDFEKKA